MDRSKIKSRRAQVIIPVTVQAVNLNAENQYKFAAVRLVCIYHGF